MFSLRQPIENSRQFLFLRFDYLRSSQHGLKKYGYDQISKQSQFVYLIHFDQLSMLVKSAENPSHFYHLSSFSNQACSACLTQIAR